MRAPARALAREGGTRGESRETAVPPCSVRASLSLPPRALRQGRAGRRVEPPHPAGRTAGARSAPRAHACVRGSQPARHGERSGARRCAALRCAQPPQQRRRERRPSCPSSVATSPRAVAPPRGRRAACAVCTHKQPALLARLPKMQNPTVTACAAAPRSLQTLARAGSLRAASGRFLQTLGQNFSS